MDLYSLLGVQSVADVVRRGRLLGGLSIWSAGVWMIGCRPVEGWKWQGQDVRERIGRLEKSV